LETSAIEHAAELLVRARREVRQLDGLPSDCTPRTLQDAYAVQERVIELLGEPVDGWLLGLTNSYMQAVFGVAGPYFARLLRSGHMNGPATVSAACFCTRGLECEVAFRMGADLPPRGRQYSAEEVAVAVAAAQPVIEIVNAHFADWMNAPLPLIVADNGTDGLLIVGPPVSDWRSLDLSRMSVSLAVNGTPVAQGDSGRAMGSPLVALTWLANILNQRGLWLRCGDLINTGTCTEIHFAEAGDVATAKFAGLGEVRVAFSR